MSLFPDSPIRVRVRGAVRQRPLDGMASLTVDAEGVAIVPLGAGLQAEAPLRIPFASIDGATADTAPEPVLRLHLTQGEQLEAAGDPRIEELQRDILTRGRAMPELTRGLRAFGTPHGGEAQEAFFRPLLEARRLAAAGGPHVLDAFDPRALRLAFEHMAAQLAVVREPGRPAAQRAIEARLGEALEPLLRALDALPAEAAAVRGASPEEALLAWRAWAHALRSIFERADAAWTAIAAMLASMQFPREPDDGTPMLDRLRRRSSS